MLQYPRVSGLITVCSIYGSRFITLLNTPGDQDLSLHVPCMDQDKDQDMEEYVYQDIYPEFMDI